MECNRDEAVRARDIAEIKYAKQDFVGAKKFVLKAQQLFPTLEGLSQMLDVLEVHSVAQIKLGGTEMDWYGILQVDPGADDSTIKKQYRRLALLLHPDKNKALGAEAAFKLIGEAWGILSDKTKRTLHDIKRAAKNTKPHVRVAMEPNVQNFQTPFTTGATTTAIPPQPNHTASTFWTNCPNCKMQYQYLKTYENYQLQCPKCKNVFLARDIHSSVNSNGAGGYGWHFDAHRQDFSFNKQPVGAAEFNGATPGHATFMNGSFFTNPASSAAFFSSAAAAAAAQSKVAAAAAAAAAASSAVPNNLAADVVSQTYAKVKRERVEAEKETKRKEKELRRQEKDLQRKEKEDLRKAREAERSREAMENLISKRREKMARDDSKRKGDARAGRKLRKKKRSSDQEEDEELEDDDPKPYEPGLQDDLSSPVLPRRRSARAKTNVTTYKVDGSDEDSDSDSDGFPAAKRAKLDGNASAQDPVKCEDENGKEAGKHQSENGTKGKSPGDDSSHGKRSVGANGGKEFDGRRHVTERNRDDQGSTPKKDSSNSVFVETSRRESKVHDSPSIPYKTRLPKSSLQESRSPVKGNPHKGDFIDEKSPSKSPRTLRIGVKSPKFFGSQSTPYEDAQIPQRRVSSPIPSVPSTPTSDEPEQESEGDDVQILVPDPDFHDFDMHRTEKDILPGQVWAVYDDRDGMPRYYARITRCSTQPFKAHACWLEHCSSEADLRWTQDTGVSITCGEFKIGKTTTMDQINCFSHIVFEKSGGRGPLKVYPKNGQVWAVFKNLDPENMTRVFGPNEEGNASTYDMVEILHDFTEGKSLIAGRLEKVQGYKTLFRRVEGIESEWTCKLTELVRFSHSVPKQQFPDKDADEFGIPRGCLELDPASTPLELMNSPSDPPS